jgi:hypothetical protein
MDSKKINPTTTTPLGTTKNAENSENIKETKGDSSKAVAMNNDPIITESGIPVEGSKLATKLDYAIRWINEFFEKHPALKNALGEIVSTLLSALGRILESCVQRAVGEIDNRANKIVSAIMLSPQEQIQKKEQIREAVIQFEGDVEKQVSDGTLTEEQKKEVQQVVDILGQAA